MRYMINKYGFNREKEDEKKRIRIDLKNKNFNLKNCHHYSGDTIYYIDNRLLYENEHKHFISLIHDLKH